MKKVFNSTTLEAVFTMTVILIVLAFSADAQSKNITLELPKNPKVFSDADSYHHSGSNLIRYTDADFQCLVANIYYEARNQSKQGQLMVASVTLNRVTMKQYPNTICGVVKHKSRTISGKLKQGGCAFSWVCDRKTKAPKLYNKIERKAWYNARKVAVYALKHDVSVLKQNITHYHTKAVKPSWSAHMAVVGVFDDHIAYTTL